MNPLYYKMASWAAMPVVAASGYAGYGYYHQNNYHQYGNGYTQTASGQLSVSGIDAPSQLPVNQSGSWTVHVSGWNSYSGGQLHYSVVWGDENMHSGYAATASYPAPTVNSTGTFTHTYVTPGTFRPIFTVTDDYGHTTQAQASTQVTGGYVGQPVYGNNYGNNYGNQSGSSYCSTNAGYYDRNCYNNSSYSGNYGTTNQNQYNNQYNSQYGNQYGSQYGTGGTTNGGYNCSTYYDRNCYSNGRYVGPSFGSNSSTYNGPGDTCYYLNGQWQGNCGNTSTTNSGYYGNTSNYNNQYGSQYGNQYNQYGTGGTTGGYTNTVGGPNGPDYSCYYDRACLAQMQGRGY